MYVYWVGAISNSIPKSDLLAVLDKPWNSRSQQQAITDGKVRVPSKYRLKNIIPHLIQ